MQLSFGGYVSTRSGFVIEITFECDSSPGGPIPQSVVSAHLAVKSEANQPPELITKEDPMHSGPRCGLDAGRSKLRTYGGQPQAIKGEFR